MSKKTRTGIAAAALVGLGLSFSSLSAAQAAPAAPASTQGAQQGAQQSAQPGIQQTQPTNHIPGLDGARPAAGTSVEPELVPLLQMNSGDLAEYNCGPVSLVMALLSAGIAPEGWDDLPTATANIRDLMGDYSGGTTLDSLETVLHHYGKDGSHVGNIDEAIAWAKEGHGVIVGGDEANPVFDWEKWLAPGAEDVGHYVYVAGYDPDRGFKVMDPASMESSNEVHYVSEEDLRSFSDFYPYASNVLMKG